MRAYISAENNINVRELLEQLREDLNLLPGQVKDYAYKIFTSREIQEFIIDANKRLLASGLRPDGSEISKTPEGNQTSTLYERYTIYNRTEGKNGYEPSQAFYVDLHKTGFFYESLKVRAGSNELLEFSDDPKSVELQRVWGNILGISDEDLLKLMNMIRPKLIKFVRDKIKLKK